jgi:hypothetical protein
MKKFTIGLAVVALVAAGFLQLPNVVGRAFAQKAVEDTELNADGKATLVKILEVYKNQIKELQDQMATTQPPVGTIMAFVGDPAAVSANWQLCDGALLKDPSSPLREVCKDGRVPNLNGKFLRGAVHVNDILKEGGKANVDVVVQLGVNIDTRYGWRKDNLRLVDGDNPRNNNAYVTGHDALGISGRNGDMARPAVVGQTDARSYAIPTLPPYSTVYYMIRIK